MCRPLPAFLLFLLIPQLCDAGYVTMRFNNVSPSQGVRIQLNGSGGFNTSAGAFNWTAKSASKSPADEAFYNTYDVGDSVITFCVELDQHVSPNNDYTYQLVSLESVPSPGTVAGGGMSGIKANYIRELFGRFYENVDNSPLEAAAFQLSIWEIVTDNVGAWDLDSGVVRELNNSAARAQAESWLGQLTGDVNQFYGNPDFANKEIFGLTSSNRQDQIVLINTPVPATALLGILGGFSIFVGRRLRSQKS